MPKVRASDIDHGYIPEPQPEDIHTELQIIVDGIPMVRGCKYARRDRSGTCLFDLKTPEDRGPEVRTRYPRRGA